VNFDLNHTPLAKGVNLIEASAGTGKTYTIAGIFLRLLLEHGLSVREILVVTYTVAATAELRRCIRGNLTAAVQGFQTGKSEDAFLDEFCRQHASEKDEMLARLERANCSFDEAPIFSIHGFCQKTLHDRAFESGSAFDTELIEDPTDLLRQAAEDFWRATSHTAGPVAQQVMAQNQFGPEKFLELLGPLLNHPNIRILSRLKDQSLASLTTALETAFENARAIWQHAAAAIKSNFGAEQKKIWANQPYNDDQKMGEWFRQLEECFAASENPAGLAGLQNFCTQSLADKTRSKKVTPRHPFFEACDAFCAAEKDLVVGLRMAFYKFIESELPRQKRRLKLQTFDDLLTRLRDTLGGSHGEKLAADLRQQYRAAMIDEFQDTDPVQYDIFQKIFSGGQNFLFLIGDPKQAIYGFRGADVFTYLEAARATTRRFSLGYNWRSEPRLIQAVNAIFERPKRPFVFSEMSFTPVAPGKPSPVKPLRSPDATEPPFELWFCSSPGSSPISKSDAEADLPGIVAQEILQLLTGPAAVGAARLKPGDIAVLVPVNRQAALMQEALAQWKIPSVLHTASSLFESPEAAELLRILLAVVQPGNERLLRSALATDILGETAPRLEALRLDQTAWQNILDEVHSWLKWWTDKGFVQMFRSLLDGRKVRARLLLFPDGERRLTNLLHLGEVLQEAAARERLSPEALVHWLAARLRSDPNVPEEYQLRLETDANAVQLVTVHKSKGLQYGIVFCPFSWRPSFGTRRDKDRVVFHDRTNRDRLTWDLGSKQLEEHRQSAWEELLAENVRVLYVALTRAIHRCYFVWGRFRQAGTSAPSWLLHQPPDGPESIARLETRYKESDDATLRADLAGLALQSHETIRVRSTPEIGARKIYQPAEASPPVLSCRSFTRPISQRWRIASFTSLTRNQSEEWPDRDGGHVIESSSAEQPAIPRGARSGSCLHEILEKLDFRADDETIAAGIESTLRRHGFSQPELKPLVSSMIRKTLETPLDPPRLPATLSQIPWEDRINEMEFYFPLKEMSRTTLASIFSAGDDSAVGRKIPPAMERLTFDPVAGFMRGFIDLVFKFEGRFYLVDWKSNWLGDRVEDYRSDALTGTMAREQYLLQYHLYTLALHKYFASRLADYDYDRHFGGVFYIFLRGLEPGRPDCGIFRARPTRQVIERLDHALIEKEIPDAG
jgi:exodeoxyribonuclease V beta subunit